MADILVTVPSDRAFFYRAADPRTLDGTPGAIDGAVSGLVETGAADAIVGGESVDPVQYPGKDRFDVLFVPPATETAPGAPHVYVARADGDPTSGEAFIQDRLIVTVVAPNSATLGGAISLVARPAAPPPPPPIA